MKAINYHQLASAILNTMEKHQTQIIDNHLDQLLIKPDKNYASGYQLVIWRVNDPDFVGNSVLDLKKIFAEPINNSFIRQTLLDFKH